MATFKQKEEKEEGDKKEEEKVEHFCQTLEKMFLFLVKFKFLTDGTIWWAKLVMTSSTARTSAVIWRLSFSFNKFM